MTISNVIIMDTHKNKLGDIGKGDGKVLHICNLIELETKSTNL